MGVYQCWKLSVYMAVGCHGVLNRLYRDVDVYYGV